MGTVAWCGDWVTVGGTGLVEVEVEVRWKESHRQDSIGRVAAGWETGADDAGNSKSCDRGYELVAICPEAWAVAQRNHPKRDNTGTPSQLVR